MTLRKRFYTADVFTDHIFGGNPLAVVPDATGLSDTQMQRIAREFSLSETAFVFPPESDDHTRRLRIFTPGTELPFAGHPTIGTAHVLAAIGEIALPGEVTSVIFEEGVGPVRVRIQGDEEHPVSAELAAPQLPKIGPEHPPTEQIAAVLSLNPAELRNDSYAPQAVSCGVPFLFVPLRDQEALARAHVDRTRWKEHIASYWAPHLYCLAFDPDRPRSNLRARMFAPAMGIDEDPATGAAATALAGYLAARSEIRSGAARWTIEQGVEMGRPSTLQVEADLADGVVEAIRVGGASVIVSEGVIEIPDVIPD